MDGADEGLTEAVDAALDALLGAVPSEFVEEQAKPTDPSAENQAMAHRYRSPSHFYGLG